MDWVPSLNKKIVLVLLISFFLIMPFLGCIEDKQEATEKENEDNNDPVMQDLTDEDWNYYVWQYITRDNLFSQIEKGWSIINATSDRNIRLLKLNESNLVKITRLNNISSEMKGNITHHLENISTYNLSYRLDAVRENQITILKCYLNISKNYSSIYDRYNQQISNLAPLSGDEYVEISAEMDSIINQSLLIQSNIITINTKLNNSISDDEYYEWAEGKNTSMFPTS